VERKVIKKLLDLTFLCGLCLSEALQNLFFFVAAFQILQTNKSRTQEHQLSKTQQISKCFLKEKLYYLRQSGKNIKFISGGIQSSNLKSCLVKKIQFLVRLSLLRTRFVGDA
jgi:hypothetical protein